MDCVRPLYFLYHHTGWQVGEKIAAIIDLVGHTTFFTRLHTLWPMRPDCAATAPFLLFNAFSQKNTTQSSVISFINQLSAVFQF